MAQPSVSELLEYIQANIIDNTSGLVEEHTLRAVLGKMTSLFGLFTPELTDEQLSLWKNLSNFKNSDSLGTITTSSTIPAEGNVWGFAGEGTYPNAGNLTVAENTLGILTRVGTTWSKVEVALPQADLSNVNRKLAADYFNDGTLTVVGNIFNKNAPSNIDKYFFNSDGAEGDLAGWSTSGFIQVKPSTTYSNSHKRFTIFYDENFQQVGSNTTAGANSFATTADTHYIRVDFETANKNSLVILEGNIYNPNMDIEAYNKANYQQVLEPTWKRVVATRNADDFNSIRELALTLEPYANYWNRYEIFVNNGEWREMDWQGWGDYIKIVGESMISTLILCDGLWTDAKYKTDDLFPYEAYRNKTFSQVWNDLGSPRFLHIIFAKKNLYAENLSFEGNNLKYIIHCDNPDYKKVHLKNVSLKQRGSNYIMGNGINGGQEIILENFIADNDPNPIKTDHAFYHHTWGNQKKGSLLHLINGTFKNGGIALLGEAGSEQQDDVIVENCKGAEMKIMWSVPEWTAGKSLWQNPATGQLETNPTNVPYCIYVWDKGTGITINEDNQSFTGHSGDVRPGRNNYLI